MRSGLTELTRATGYSADSLRATSRQSSKLPLTWSSLAPWTRAWASLPMAILPRGTRTAQVMPARAAEAAALALVLPVEAQITAWAPRPAAALMATVMPRSLNEPVGFSPSTLRETSQPVRADSTGAGSSGVPPSNSVTTGVVSSTGSRSRYSATTPRQARPVGAPRLGAPASLLALGWLVVPEVLAVLMWLMGNLPRLRPASRWPRHGPRRVTPIR